MSATGGVGERELRAALGVLSVHAPTRERRTLVPLLDAAIDELVAARAALAPLGDDYPTEVFRELWRVLVELRAATGEEGRA